MNYRHAFHAGNFADCVKHALLVWLLRAMARKPAGFLVLDTHAGEGGYDLGGEQASRTGEWRRGIARLLDDPPEPLWDFVSLVTALGRDVAADDVAGVSRSGALGPGALGVGVPVLGASRADAPGVGPPRNNLSGLFYPGSPLLARTVLRPQDRLVCCELHGEAQALLQRRLSGDRRVFVHRRDGFEAVRAFLPPPERRALVLLDPPFEQPGEFDRLLDALRQGQARLPDAVLAAWYPLKGRAPARFFADSVAAAGLRDAVSAELWLREPTDPSRLNGCGLLVLRPPFQFEAQVPPLLSALLDRLGDGEPGQGTLVRRICDE